MPNKATVRGVLMDATLAPISQGKVVATLIGADTFGGTSVVTQRVEATTNAQGEWTLPLLVNAEGDNASTSWTVEGYNQYVAKVFEVKALFIAAAGDTTLGELEKTSSQNQKAAKDAVLGRLIVAQGFSSYDALPFGQKRDSDLVLIDDRDLPLVIHNGVNGGLFRGVSQILVGDRSVALTDARGVTLVQAGTNGVPPQISEQPSIQPAQAAIGDSITLRLGAATGTPTPEADWDVTLNGSSVKGNVNTAQMRLPITAAGEYVLSVTWRNSVGAVAATAASLVVSPPSQTTVDMTRASAYFDRTATISGSATAVTGINNLGVGGYNLVTSGTGNAVVMGADGLVFDDARSMQAINLSHPNVDGVFIVVRGVLSAYGSGVAQILAANPSGGTIAIMNTNGVLQARYHDGAARTITLGNVAYGQDFTVGLEIDNAARRVRAWTLAGAMVSETPAGTPGVNIAAVRMGQYVRGTIKRAAVVTRQTGGSFPLRFEDVISDFRVA